MNNRVVTVMIFVGLSASLARGDISAIGDVNPANPPTWTTSTMSSVGKTGVGSVTVDGGSDLFSWLCNIGERYNSSGAVTVSGAGSTWTNPNGLQVGARAKGTLEITDGGVVSSGGGKIGAYPGSTGMVTVRGHGSTWTGPTSLLVGSYGNATLNISNGGVVSSRSASIADRPGVTGAVTVAGPGAAWMTSWIVNVGNYGKGTLGISAGGTVSNDGCSVGRYVGATGAVTVNGPGTTWTPAELLVGSGGNGTLEITNGGAVSGTSGRVAWSGDVTGAVTVSGPGSRWTSSLDVFVGVYGVGTLDIYDGALVSVADELRIDYDGDGDSFVTMGSGGRLALFGDADDSLADFLALMAFGTRDIRYWDDSVRDWAHITGATAGEDYTLGYLVEGELSGYTVLTVMSVPEPATLSVLALGGLAMLRRRRVDSRTYQRKDARQ